MSNTTYAGINYAGHSGANQDKETGIHFGVIPSYSINPDALEDIYQNGTDLGFEAWKEEVQARVKSAVKESLEDYISSRHIDDIAEAAADSVLDSDWLGDSYNSDGASSYLFEQDGYKILLCADGDIFVERSPYKTRAQFCSPCAPGAGYLLNPCEVGPECYALGPDFFDGENAMPYEVKEV